MNNIKIPGFLWVVLIVVVIIALETYVPVGYRMYSEVAVVALLGLAKAFNLDSKQVEELLAMIRRLQAQVPVQEASYVAGEVEAAKSSNLEKWLVG